MGALNIWLMPSAFQPHRGGVEEATLQLGRFLVGNGHDVRVLTHRHPPTLPAVEAIEGLDVERLAFTAPAAGFRPTMRFARDAPRSLREMFRLRPHPDVVHVNCASSQLNFGAAFAQLTSAALVLTTQGEIDVDADDLFRRSVYARTSLRVASRLAAATTACSSWTAESAGRIAPRLANAIVIPNGIDPGQWEPAPASDSPVVAAWGRHVPQKGFDLLLDAWPLVIEAFDSARLLLGGEGTETPALQARAHSSVEFLGALDRQGVAAMLRRSRIVVVPSRLEPFGIVALEAMASGRPVVWSVHGGLQEATGALGWGVDPYDRSALARALVDALRADSDPRALRRHAEKFSWAILGQRYLEVYEKTLSSQRGSARTAR